MPALLFQFTGPPVFAVLDEQGNELGRAESANVGADTMVYVPTQELPELRTHLNRCLPRMAGNQLVGPPLRAWLLHSALTFEVEALMANLQAPNNGRGPRTSRAPWAARAPPEGTPPRIATASWSKARSRRCRMP